MRDFTRLWTAATGSSLGDGVTAVAGPLLAATLTRDPVAVAGLMVAEQLPWLVFALPSGAMVDRMDRRMVLVAAGVIRMVSLGLLGLLVGLGHASLPMLYVIFLLAGCAGVLFDNASLTVLPAAVGPADLERANGRMMASRTLFGELLAPMIGGLLFAAAAWSAFVLDAMAFALVAVLCLGLSRAVGRVSDQPERVPLRAAIGEGVRWLRRHRLLRTLAVTVALSNLSLGALWSIMVLLAKERLGLDSVGYGLLLAAAAVGGVAGGLLTPRIVAALGPGTTMRIGLIVEALTYLGLALTRSAVLAGVIIAALGLHLVVFSTIGATMRQSLVPAALLGRVHSAYRLMTTIGMLLGAAVGGLIARYFGLTAPFWLGLVAVIAVTVAVWRVFDDGDIRAARSAAAAWEAT